MTAADKIRSSTTAATPVFDTEDAAATSARDSVPDLAAAYERMPAPALLIDTANDRIIHANRAASRITGHPRTRLTGRRASSLFPDAGLQALWQRLLSREQDGAELTGTLEVRSGDPLPVQLLIRTMSLGGCRYCLLLAVDIGRLWQQLDELDQRVRSDALTGLLSRASFEDELGQRCQRAPGGRSMALLALDINDLKRVNEAYGRRCGDEVLINIGERLQQAFAHAGLLARHDSDKFMILLEDLPADLLGARDHAEREAQRSLACIREPDSTTLATLTGTAGVALWPHQAGTAAELLRNTDLALSHAKTQGRDQYRLFTDEDLRAMREEASLEAALRRTIDSGEIGQVWLPVVRIEDESCIGVEALLRGHGATAGFSTQRIIEIADRHRLLPQLGRIGLDKAGRTYRYLVSKRRAEVIEYFGINLRVQELLATDYPEQLIAILDAAGIPISCIMLELSEADLIGQQALLAPILTRLRQMRVGIAIDGFGAGPSSLALLRDLPVDVVKLDRSFVWQLESSPRDREIVRAMITMARNLDTRVVAVGVETRAQLELLREAGCDLAQGHLFSRPLPEDELPAYLRRHVLARRR